MRLVSLGEIATIDRKTVKPEDIVNGTTYVGLEHIVSGGELRSVGPVSKGELTSGKFAFDDRHILYGKLRPYLAKIAVSSFDGVCSTDILPIRVQPAADKMFVAHFLRQGHVVDQVNGLAAGANLPRISPSALLTIQLLLPPLDEQRRIATILDKADELRSKRREALARLDTLAQSIFHSTFSAGANCSTTVPLDEVAEVQGGLQVTSKRDALPGRAPYLRVANVYRGRLDLRVIKEIGLTSAERQRTTLQQGDLLIVEGHGNPAEIGRCGLWTGEVADCVHQNHLIRVRVDISRVNPVFAMHFLNSLQGRQFLLRAANTTSGLNTISTSTVKACPITVPPLKLQQAFAIRVAAVERLKELHRKHLAELDALFASLQHRAFKGEL